MPPERSNAGNSGRQRSGRGGSSSRDSSSRRGGGFRGRGQGGGRGGRGGFRGSSAPYRVPTNPPQATLQFRNANESDINNKLDQPGIKSITFGVDFQVQ
ncbi:hypothetical protein Moror_5976, partial [Moniliophthora roreri MCA 2997]